MTTELISNSLIPKIKPKAKHYDIRDSSLKGFLIRVNPSGHMSYVVQYARGKRYTIGSTEVYSAKEAREKARTILGKAADGEDVNKRTPSGNALSLNQFLEKEYIPWATANLKSGLDSIQKIKYSFSHLLDLPLTEINTHKIDKWRTKQQETLKPGTLNRNTAALKALLSKAVTWGFLEANPLASLKPIKLDTIPRELEI